MARFAINLTKSNLRFDAKPAKDLTTLRTTLTDASAAIDATAVDAAQAAAEANATIAGDGTALGLVQTIGTEFAAYELLVTAVTDAATALVAELTPNVLVDVDAAVITSLNDLRAALDQAKRLAERGVGGLS